MSFVKIKNRVLDQQVLERKQILVKNHIIISIKELLQSYGFEKRGELFVNEEINMRIDVEFDKLEKEIIV